MRQFSQKNEGLAMQNDYIDTILREGEQVIVNRPARVGGTPTTQLLYCMPQPIGPERASRLLSEGIINSLEPTPYNFIFPGNTDVAINDAVTFVSGNMAGVWKVLTNIGEKNQGTQIGLECVAIRQR
jgi:hypothetical protein